MKKLICFISGLCVLFIYPSHASAQDIHFELVPRQTNETGGPVNSIAQDRRGFLWLGTLNGLFKYDGFQYAAYHCQASNPNGLTSDDVECVTADKQGFIWIGHFHNSSGLERLDPSTGIFTHFRHQENDIYSISSDSVTSILQDHGGTIWIGTYKGLNRFDSGTNRFYRYQHKENDPASLSCNDVRTIYEDKEGTLWLGTGEPWGNEKKEGGLNKLNRETGKFTRYLHKENDPHSLTDNRIRAIFEDSQGNFWVGSAGDGLHKMDRKTGSFERLLYNPARPDGLSRPPVQGRFQSGDDHITFITEDIRGRLWIGTFNGGINVYDPVTKKSSWYGSGKNSKEKLKDNNYWAACKTTDGLIWICDWNPDLYKINPCRVYIPYTQIGASASTFAEDNAQGLWIGSTKGLFHLDSNKVIHQYLIDKDSSSEKNSIHFIEKDDHNRLWLATSHGLKYFNPATNQISAYQPENGNANRFLQDYISVISKTKDNKLWLGTYYSGLKLLDINTGAIVNYEHNPADSNSLNNNAVISIDIDKNENLWVGTLSGLNRLDKQTGHFRKYLNKQVVTCIMEDSEEDVWAGTGSGFYRYDHSADKFLNFVDQSGILKSNWSINGMAEDHQQNLWLNTINGILKLNKERTETVLFGKNQGYDPLAATNFGYERRNGEILFGDTAGYFTFRSDLMQQDTSRMRVTISSLLLNDKAVEPSTGGILTAPLEQTSEIHLNHYQNTFSFQYSVIDFVSNHEDTRVFYMLQNYDNKWRLSNESREAYYFNLPPGNYIFKVKAYGANGRSTEKQIAVFISPPWWTTWWAYTIYGLCLLAGIFLIDRIRRKGVIEKERSRTREKELAQAKEIEKAYKQLETAHENLKSTQGQLIQSEKMASLGELTAGIAHEIQNPLNFMNNFSEVNTELIEEMKEELKAGNNTEAVTIADNIAENEKKINIHGKRADAIVKGMLLHSRTHTGQKEPADINALADEYLRLSYHGLRARDKSFNATMKTDFDQSIGNIPIISQDIGRVLYITSAK